MYLWVISLLACAVSTTGYINTVFGVKYKVNLNSIGGNCVISVYENNTNNDRPPYPWTANVTLRSEYMQLGWDYVHVVTNPHSSDADQAYGAGYCEGALTCQSIFNHWTNVVNQFCVNQTEFCDKVNRYLDGNLEWISSMIENNINDSFWHQIHLFYRQINGIYYGQKRCRNSLSKRDILWMNMMPEIEEMKDAFNMSQMSMKVRGSSRCSAIVKLLPDFSDLFVAHNTWTGYKWMLRQVKKYSFGYHLTKTSNKTISGSTMVFSGYPGIISSIDDFYVVDSGLVVLETTIGNENKTLWKNAEDPKDKVSTLARSVVANRLSTSGSEWVNTYAYKNNGLYNNQWMVVDMKRFTPGAPPKNGTLWILEQLPSFTLAEDKTEVLRRQTFWPSYNIPSSPIIFNMSGNEELVNKFGEWFSYKNAPRAKIFDRDQNKVVDTSSLLNLMRYNDYKNDPLSRCNCTPPYSAENAIASRCDLNPVNGIYPFPALSHRSHGAIDAKITTYNLSKRLQFSAVCGPSKGTNLPEFDWSKSDYKDTVSHVGQPDVFRFPIYLTDSAV